MLQPLLTVTEAHRCLKVSTATIYKMVERGELRHVRVSNAIRIRAVDLAQFLSAQPRGRQRQ